MLIQSCYRFFVLSINTVQTREGKTRMIVDENTINNRKYNIRHTNPQFSQKTETVGYGHIEIKVNTSVHKSVRAKLPTTSFYQQHTGI